MLRKCLLKQVIEGKKERRTDRRDEKLGSTVSHSVENAL